MKPSTRDILFLLPYPLGVAPSQRFRVEAYFPVLDAAKLQWRCAPFFNMTSWQILYNKGSLLRKVWAVLEGFLRRFVTICIIAPRYKYIFVHREAAPLGPPVFEWMLTRVFGKTMIYDFDDAIWIPNVTAANQLANRFKAFWKVGYICRYATTIVGGNDFLCNYARTHMRSGNVIKIPTVVDTQNRYNQLQNQCTEAVTVGWTGSHSTLPYLDLVMPLLAKLQETLPFTFIVIADKKPELPLANWQFIHWDAQTEIEDLLRIHIGIMPLSPDPWSEGKCGFKIIQYLSLGIPAVASAVGVNKEIIDQDENGFIAETAADWENYLRLLITAERKRLTMGEAGREKIMSYYSLHSQQNNFLSLFQ